MRVILLCLFVGLAAAIDLSRPHKTYKGYKVLEIFPANDEQLKIVHGLAQDPEDVNHGNRFNPGTIVTLLDFWSEWTQPGLPARVMLPPHRVGHTIEYIEDNNIDFRVMNNDVGVQVAEELSRLRSRASGNMAFDINQFNTYDDIMTELDAMALRCPEPLVCTVETLGSSYEGRAIKVLRISASATPGLGYWIDSAIHAREWLAPASVLKIMDHFTRNYGTDPDVTSLINSYDWHFVPVMNPDGYEFSWTDERYWRKSRNINAGSACIGTDLNRNYDSSWSTDGSSPSECSDTYQGSSPASEPETQVIQNELVRLGPSRLAGMVSVHTAAQMWLHPYGHTISGVCQRSDDHDDLYRVVTAAADATENTYNTVWTRGTICETIYPASGGTCDFAHSGALIPFSYTPELRGPDFVTAPSEIEPSFQEFYNGVKAMVAEINPASPKK